MNNVDTKIKEWAKTVLTEDETQITESSLTRLMTHNESHDCIVMTAFRNENTGGKNLELNAALGMVLRKRGYGTTKVIESYKEENMEKEHKEQSWFVVNTNDDSDFLDYCANLAEKDNQDSILVIPRGQFSSGKCFLYGTKKPNDGEELFVPYHEKKNTEGIKINGDDVFFTRLKGKRFAFQLIESSEDILNEKMGSFSNAMVLYSCCKNHYGVKFTNND